LLVVLVLRARTVPWRRPRPASAVVFAAGAAATSGLLLAVSPLRSVLRMDAPPISYGIWLLIVTAGYGLAAQLVKRRYLRHQQIWL
jgi:Mg2+-importing ATPase